MATKIASLFADLDLKDGMTGGLKKAEKGLDSLSGKAKNVTSGIGSMFAGLGVTLSAGLAISCALDIDRQMANIRSVTGATKAEISTLRGELLAMGSSSTLGATATVEAFYDIASGVTDASKHMAILTASMQLAEAGQADLSGATKGMISIMNAYGFASEKASMVSDVFSRAVGLGVGSMDEFVAAMSPVGGTMNAAGISISEFGASMALLTKKGATASQSATRLQAAVTALLNPNTKLTAALKSVGVESGSALLKQEGLAGALRKLNEAVGGSTDEMAKMLGRTEGLQGALALLDPSSLEFFTLFDEGLAGATATARELQLDSPAAKFDILRNRIEGVVLQIGTALLPIFSRIVDFIAPVVEGLSKLIGQFGDWATTNPELADTITKVAIGIGALVLVIPVLSGVAAAAGKALALLTSPLMLLAGIAVLAGGDAIKATLDGVRDGLGGIVEGVGSGDLSKIGVGIKSLADGIGAIPMGAAEKIGGILGVNVREGLAAWSSIPDNLGTILSTIGEKVRGAFAILLSPDPTVEGSLAKLWNDVFGAEGVIGKIVFGLFVGEESVIGRAVAAATGIFSGLINIGREIADKIGQAFTALITIITYPFRAAIKFIGEVLMKVSEAGGMFSHLYGMGTKLIGASGILADGTDMFGKDTSGYGAGDRNEMGNLAKLQGRASGGPVFAGRPYIVGEQGPELFIPRSGGGIVPNHAIPRSGGGKRVVQLHLDGKVIYETILKERRAVNARDF